MSRSYLVVEGHGEMSAALNLVVRLAMDLGLYLPHWAEPIRGKNLHQQRGIEKVCNLVRLKGDADALLILRDEDDECPATVAPSAAEWIRDANLPFRAALVLAHREYEALFLPCIAKMAGKPLIDERGVKRDGILSNAAFNGNPEGIRGVKEWLSDHMPSGRSYKPTLDQLPLTRMIEFSVIREHEPPLPCFGTLERALSFLAGGVVNARTSVYPFPRDVG